MTQTRSTAITYVPMGEMLAAARAGGYAVPSFCAWNAESLLTILQTAARLRAPVIVMNGPAEHALLEPEVFASIARSVPDQGVPAALLLDHGDTLELAQRTVDAGYTSAMLDLSQAPFDENVRGMRQLVEYARPHGVTVEGEIGHVGTADGASVEGARVSTLTDPDDAVRFVAQTGVDALAISIGNGHGAYTRLPVLEFDRLAAIAQAVEIPLVLHGGSGTPDADLARAISLGLAKVNVATDLVSAWCNSLRAQWDEGRNKWPPLAFAEATAALRPVVERWIRRTGAEGKA